MCCFVNPFGRCASDGMAVLCTTANDGRHAVHCRVWQYSSNSSLEKFFPMIPFQSGMPFLQSAEALFDEAIDGPSDRRTITLATRVLPCQPRSKSVRALRDLQDVRDRKSRIIRVNDLPDQIHFGRRAGDEDRHARSSADAEAAEIEDALPRRRVVEACRELHVD